MLLPKMLLATARTLGVFSFDVEEIHGEGVHHDRLGIRKMHELILGLILQLCVISNCWTVLLRWRPQNRVSQ